jgi:hypothetical protein
MCGALQKVPNLGTRIATLHAGVVGQDVSAGFEAAIASRYGEVFCKDVCWSVLGRAVLRGSHLLSSV